jgi:hypothetical protein
MAFIRKHWDVSGEQMRRIEADPDSATTPGDEAVLSYLTLPDNRRGYSLGRYVIGRFEPSEEGYRGDCLHTGSVLGDDFQKIAEGEVVEDTEKPDGLYEIYVPF